MKLNNPFSFRVYKRKKYKKLISGFFVFLTLGLLIFIAGAVLQKTRKQHIAGTKIMPLSSGERQNSVKYNDFEKKEDSLPEVQDGGDEGGHPNLSDLARIFQRQEKQKKAFFKAPLWQKNAATGVSLNDKPPVAVIINHAQDLTLPERAYLNKTGVKWGYLFTKGGREAKRRAAALRKAGHEIFLVAGLSPSLYKAVGIVTDKGRADVSSDFLTVPRKKTALYTFFTFPLIRDLPRFQKSKRVLLVLTPRKHRIRNFYDWVRRQKKNRQFLPPSQLVTSVTISRQVVDPQVVEKAAVRGG